MVSTVEQRPMSRDADLHRQIMRLRQVDNHTNLLFLAVEYLSLADRDRRRGRFRRISPIVGACPGYGTCPCSRSRSF